MALPRGGVPVAYEIARVLHVPLDVITVHKMGIPGNSELAMGTIASGGIRIINHDIVRLLNITQFAIDTVAAEEQQKIEHRERIYRNGWPAHEIYERTVIVVDDGIATGATMRAAVMALRQRSPARIIVTAPTISQDSHKLLSEQADEIVSLSTPTPYISVGRWYEDFTETSDEDVSSLLIQATKDLCVSASYQSMH